MPYLEEWLPKIQNHNRLKSSVGLLIDEIEEMRPLKERIFDGFDKEMIPVPPREPFATIAHNDCWVNNIMVKLESGLKKVNLDIYPPPPTREPFATVSHNDC